MKPKLNYKPGPMDNCQTPAYAVAPLLPYLSRDRELTMWESAAGEGFLADALRDAGFFVLRTDILSGYSFYEQTWTPGEHNPWDVEKEKDLLPVKMR